MAELCFSKSLLRTTIVVAATCAAWSQAVAAQDQWPQSPANTNPYGQLFTETHDGAFSYQFDGRVLLDAAFYSKGENPLANGAELRDARAGVKAKLWYDWRAELDLNFADNEIGIRDAWIAYAGFDSSVFKIGNFKEPFSLEELHSKRFITFIERGLPNLFVPGRHIGIGYNHWGQFWQVGTGFFGQEAGDFDDRELNFGKDPDEFRGFHGENQGYGASGRFTVVATLADEVLVHLGVATAFRDPDIAEQADQRERLRFRTRPETHVNRTRFANTGQIKEVEHYVVYGAELAASFRSLSFQSEYMKTVVYRFNGEPELSFDGAYAQLSWMVTGESRPYVTQDGEFAPIVPARASGAWELAARYSALDLNDANGGVLGGREDIFTFGVNWYINTNLRVMVNYALVDNDENANDDGAAIGGDRFGFVQTRFQVTY